MMKAPVIGVTGAFFITRYPDCLKGLATPFPGPLKQTLLFVSLHSGPNLHISQVQWR
jgi:hypothetical protein